MQKVGPQLAFADVSFHLETLAFCGCPHSDASKQNPPINTGSGTVLKARLLLFGWASRCCAALGPLGAVSPCSFCAHTRPGCGTMHGPARRGSVAHSLQPNQTALSLSVIVTPPQCLYPDPYLGRLVLLQPDMGLRRASQHQTRPIF
ncbi:hypothetical protein VTK26DRAFT_5482 [Humicola hyalothermophila]